MAFDKKYNAKEVEPKIRKFWEENNIYKFDENSSKVVFSIDTPPPTISGKMHIGHAFSYTQTDFVARFKRMTGHEVFYPFGTDDNGLATEKLVQKQKKVNLRKVPREEAIKICTDFLEEERPIFIQDFKNIGLSCDFDVRYSTIDDKSRRLSQDTFLTLYKKGLIYRKEGPVMWDRVFQTPIAQAELEDLEVKSTMNYVKAKVKSTTDTYMIFATTRPELLFACQGMSVEDEGDYVKLKVDSEYWIISALTYEENMKKFGIEEYEVIEELKGQTMIGESAIIPVIDKEIIISHDLAVKADFGTGIAYFCSYGGQEDIEYFARHNLEPVQVLNSDGRLNEKCLEFEGMLATEARPKVIAKLDEIGVLIKSEKITHVVNVGERSGVEVEYIVTKQWYVNYLDKKEYFFEQAQKFNWHPNFMKHRLENWIKGLNWDWGFSRQRHFGIPVPVWYGKTSGKIYLADPKQLPCDPTSQKPELKKNIYFVRHANYDSNNKEVINIDPSNVHELSPKGIENVKKLRSSNVEFANVNFDKVYVSEFLRTQQTAELLVDKKINDCDSLFELNSDLNEIILGSDGDSVESYRKLVADDITKEDGVIAVKKQALIEFIEELKVNDEQNILVVTHKDNLKLIKSYFENIEMSKFLDIKFDNLEIYNREFDFTPNEELEGETDIMDTWFTSASSPFLAVDRINNEDMKKKLFPMDLRPQAHDIINFWLFYTMAKTNLLTQENPFKNVAVSGWVLDPKGKKMSKSKGNTIAPQDVVEKFSNDGIRYAASSSKLGNDIPYQEKEVQSGIKLVNKLYNANKFASMLLDDFTSDERNIDMNKLYSIDKWILARCEEVAKTAKESFENYDYQKAKQVWYDFFMSDLADNYIEIVKTRLWQKLEGYKQAQSTIYQVLYNSLKGIAPIMPYITEEIYQNFYKNFEEEISIHRTHYPELNYEFADKQNIIESGNFVARQLIAQVRQFKSQNSMSMKDSLEEIKVQCNDKLKEFIENSIEDIKAVTNTPNIIIEQSQAELTISLK